MKTITIKTITIKALAGDHNAQNINILNGVEDQSNFVEYMDEPLSMKLDYGYMEFVVEQNKLYTTTEYAIKPNQTLTDAEIAELIKYTQGQWSDGIGEGFEQFPCKEENGKEIFLSPWYRGQVATYTLN